MTGYTQNIRLTKIKNCLISFIVLVGCFVTFTARSQVKKNPSSKPVTSTTPAQKQTDTTPLKIRALWGNNPGGNMLVADGINYTDSSLRVVDDKGNRFPILSFQFIYRRKATITDDQTGAIKNTWDLVGTTIVNDSSLSEVWRNTIKQSLQRDEEWLIDFITIKDKNGRKIMTTPLHFYFK
jgi:hypothetical protein